MTKPRLKTGMNEVEKNSRTWFALTAKGKAHVARLETFYAAW